MMHPGFRHLFSFVERGGWYAADNFVTWMARKLDSGSHHGKPRAYSGLTMREFFAATGTHLTLIASDTTDHRMLVLNHITAPDLPLVWAVRMSMSIPLVWQEVEWQENWGTYRGNALTGNCIVDGGLLSNFPVELFVSDLPHVTNVMGEKEDNPILGLLIDEEMEVPGAPPVDDIATAMSDLGALRTLGRVKGLLDTAMQAHDKMVIDAFQHLVVRMPAKDYGTVEFDMSDRAPIGIGCGRTPGHATLSGPPGPRHDPAARGRSGGRPGPDAVHRRRRGLPDAGLTGMQSFETARLLVRPLTEDDLDVALRTLSPAGVDAVHHRPAPLLCDDPPAATRPHG